MQADICLPERVYEQLYTYVNNSYYVLHLLWHATVSEVHYAY